MLREELPRYLEEVAKAQTAFPQLPIRIGLECDFIAGRESWIEELAGLAEWDFLIGSVHYLPEGWEVDHPKYVGRHAGMPKKSGRAIGALMSKPSAAGSSILWRIPTSRRSTDSARRATCGDFTIL